MSDRARRRRRVSDEVRDAAVAALAASRQERGLKARVRRVAGELGVGERTVWRWLDAVGLQPAKRARGSFSVTDQDIAELAYRHGNIAAVHRARRGSPSIWTLRRAFARSLTPGQLAGLKGGERTRRAFDTYLVRPPTQRNECWEADHCQLAIEVLLGDGQVIKPWLTSFVDRFSRAVCGWAISGYPSQESVLAALRAAIMTEPPYGPVGGIPVSLRWDRGKEFLANAVGSALAPLVSTRSPCRLTRRISRVLSSAFTRASKRSSSTSCLDSCTHLSAPMLAGVAEALASNCSVSTRLSRASPSSSTCTTASARTAHSTATRRSSAGSVMRRP